MRVLRNSVAGIALFGALLALLLNVQMSRGFAQPQATVTISPPSQVVRQGETVNVSVEVAGADNVGAFEFRLRYAPNVLKYVATTDGGFLGSSGRPVQCLSQSPDKESVLVGCVSSGETPAGPSGGGRLAELTFQALSSGTSPLTFLKLQIVRPVITGGADDDIFAGLGEGIVQVLGDAEPTPGSLPPTPTANPKALTPTLPAGVSGTPVPSLGIDHSGGSSDDTAGSTDSARATAKKPRSGEVAAAGNSRSSDDFPIAGSGDGTKVEPDGPGSGTVWLAVCGAALMSIGLVLRWRGDRGSEQHGSRKGRRI